MMKFSIFWEPSCESGGNGEFMIYSESGAVTHYDFSHFIYSLVHRRLVLQALSGPFHDEKHNFTLIQRVPNATGLLMEPEY